MNRLFAVLTLALFCTVASQAGLSVSYVNTTGVSGAYVFNYNLAITSGDELAPNIAAVGCNGSTPPGSCPAGSTFATIYDIPNLVQSPTSPSVGGNLGWGFLVQFLGDTPQTPGGPESPSFGDDPTLLNVTFYYTGSVQTGPFTMTGFSITTANATNATRTGSYTSEVTDLGQANLGQTGVAATNYSNGPLTLPGIPVIGTPEPASIGLLGLGLVGLGFAGRKKLRRS